MRVLVVATLYYPNIVGGAEISTQLLCETLVKRGHIVHVLTTCKGKTFSAIVNGVTVVYINQKNIYWKYPDREKSIFSKLLYHTLDIYNFFYKKEILKIIRNFRPDVINTQNLCGLSTFIWRVAELNNVGVIHTLRDYYLLCPKQTMMSRNLNCSSQCFVCQVYSAPKRILSQRVSAVVGISKYILNRHLEYGFFSNSNHIECISNSIKSRPLGDRESLNRIGYIGRLTKEKGVEVLIQAFKSIKNSDYELVIAGSGTSQYVSYLKALATNARIRFLGQVENESFFPQIDLLVVPSLWGEPFGRVVIEANSFGIPVFASDLGGLPELISDNNRKVYRASSICELASLPKQFFEKQLTFSSEKIHEEAKIGRASCRER